jgi:BTB/POZ domain-containing protein KCTD9
MIANRLRYEDSCLKLQPNYIDVGSIVHMPSQRPQSDDPSPLGVSFFRTSVGPGVDLSNLTLPRTFFGRSEVKEVVFQNTDFTESNMCWNDFTHVDFTNAILTGSDLRASSFNDVKFESADLRNTDMRHSSFEGCDFTNAEMTGAVLTRALGAKLSLSDKQRAMIMWADDDGVAPKGG